MVLVNSSSQNLWSIIGQAQERKSAMEAAWGGVGGSPCAEADA